MSDFVCPQPQEFQDRMKKLGWDSAEWVPTPGIMDEATEFYVTLGNRHFHIGSINQVMQLPDIEIITLIEEKTSMSLYEMRRQYAFSADEWQEHFGALDQEVS